MDISLVGMDGSGKTSLANALVNRLNSEGIKTHFVDWFRGSPFKELAAIFNDSQSMSPNVLAALHVGATHWAKISAPSNQVRVWDRCIFSSYASCRCRGATDELMTSLITACPKPNWSIFLRSDPVVCFSRVLERGAVRYYESGCDRIFGDRALEGAKIFERGGLSPELVRELFLYQMFEWNKYLEEILKEHEHIIIEDFDLTNLDETLDQIIERVRKELRM